MRALIIRPEPLQKILDGKKTWEIRGQRTRIRGRIGLIESGSGQVIGFCHLVDCKGPLTLKELRSAVRKHRIPLKNLYHEKPYPKTYAWVLKNAHRLKHAISYRHKPGVIIWHPLPLATRRKIEEAQR